LPHPHRQCIALTAGHSGGRKCFLSVQSHNTHRISERICAWPSVSEEPVSGQNVSSPTRVSLGGGVIGSALTADETHQHQTLGRRFEPPSLCASVSSCCLRGAPVHTPAPPHVPQLITICWVSKDAVCRSTHGRSPPPPRPAPGEPTDNLRGRPSWHRRDGPRSPPARWDPGAHWPRCGGLGLRQLSQCRLMALRRVRKRTHAAGCLVVGVVGWRDPFLRPLA
jgi:hypothetical protein